MMTKTGAGTLVYGGTGATDTFGGTYQQLEGNLIIRNATFGTPDATTGRVAGPESINSAVMGTDTTVYDIRTGSVTLAQDSTMKGASATFSGDSTLLLSDGSVLDFGTRPPSRTIPAWASRFPTPKAIQFRSPNSKRVRKA
ncbi:MAG: hypothetical protein ACLSUW_06065 [Akkermansia sp.]